MNFLKINNLTNMFLILLNSYLRAKLFKNLFEFFDEWLKRSELEFENIPVSSLVSTPGLSNQNYPIS